ncbi:MAG: enoyl-CoA hydratase/isomerase family protein, partial [Acidobacteria bacterium]|nr:enoyl-CoA hydratase/isomerase family protein [Acidobacteriota bacterium]
RCFSAGASVAEHQPEQAPEMVAALTRACVALAELPVPAVAMVHGSCLGGAMELVSFCDFVVADPDATLGQPEIKLAFFPPLACHQLPRLTGLQNAAYVVLTGEGLSAEQAAAMGLVQRVLDKDRWTEIDEIFNGLSAAALRMTKKALRVGAGAHDAARLKALEDLFLTDLYGLEDVAEGISSFQERRRPSWKHR